MAEVSGEERDFLRALQRAGLTLRTMQELTVHPNALRAWCRLAPHAVMGAREVKRQVLLTERIGAIADIFGREVFPQKLETLLLRMSVDTIGKLREAATAKPTYGSFREVDWIDIACILEDLPIVNTPLAFE